MPNYLINLIYIILLTAIFILIELVISNLNDPDKIIFNEAMEVLSYIWMMVYFLLKFCEAIDSCQAAEKDRPFADYKSDFQAIQLGGFVGKILMIPVCQELIRNSEMMDVLIPLVILLVFQSCVQIATVKVKHKITNQQYQKIQINHKFNQHHQFSVISGCTCMHLVPDFIGVIFFPILMVVVPNILTLEDEIYQTLKELVMVIIVLVFIQKIFKQSLDFIVQRNTDSNQRKRKIANLKKLLRLICQTSNLIGNSLFIVVLLTLYDSTGNWVVMLCVVLISLKMAKDLLIICVFIRYFWKQRAIQNRALAQALIRQQEDRAPVLIIPRIQPEHIVHRNEPSNISEIDYFRDE